MNYDPLTLNKLRALPIISVAEKLGMHLYGMGKLNRRCVCPFHDDHKPSLHLNATKNIFKCFSCGKGGDVISLVMQVENLRYPDACQWLIKEFHIVVIPPETTETRKPTSAAPEIPQAVIPLDASLVTKSLSLDSQFCKSVVSSGYLSDEQLRHASQQYLLGISRDGGVVFWQIDEQQRIRTGKVMYYQPDCHRIKSHHPTWVHTLLKHQLPADYILHRCLFGQHLLSGKAPGATVCVVESEKTAVICSEHFPDCLWLACGGLQMFSPEMLAPLVDYKVVIFPDTDPQGEAFRKWTTVVQEAQRLYPFRYPLRVSSLLEQHATPEQKSHKIDLIDLLFRIPNS